MESWFGIDIDDLDPGHSLRADPTVARLRETAAMLGQDIWIAVKLPGEYGPPGGQLLADDDGFFGRGQRLVPSALVGQPVCQVVQ